MQKLEYATKIYPLDSVAWKLKGKIYFGKEDFSNAFWCFDAALKSNQNDKESYYFRGSIYYGLGQYEKAIGDVRICLALQPERPLHVKALFLKGDSQRMRGQYRLSLLDFEEAIQLAPTCALCYLSRARAYLGVGEMKNAVKDYKAAALLGNKEAQKYFESQNIKYK